VRSWARALVALGVATATTAGGYAVAADGSPQVALGPGVVTVTMDVEHSRFSIDELTVHQGTLVRFVVTNRDPILHELVVGDDEVHARHATGHEAFHPPVPGEVSLQPGETGLTFYEVGAVGDIEFMCHLPGHAEYGMTGVIHVVQ
jgi:uncharacterized cupredoxin-like copper-binding protein